MGTWVLTAAFFSGPVLCLAAMVALVSDPQFDRMTRARACLRGWWRTPRDPDPHTPTGRPIEDIALDARRLGRQLQHTNDGRSAARIGVIRRSYDDVLAEGCAALGLAELLGVLPDGPELDAERRRVEVVLTGAGMVLEDTF
jgi:hypothetical protein